jgi:hypothetical protein
VFAVVEDWERAVWLERELKDRFPQFETTISTGNDGGGGIAD